MAIGLRFHVTHLLQQCHEPPDCSFRHTQELKDVVCIPVSLRDEVQGSKEPVDVISSNVENG